MQQTQRRNSSKRVLVGSRPATGLQRPAYRLQMRATLLGQKHCIAFWGPHPSRPYRAVVLRAFGVARDTSRSSHAQWPATRGHILGPSRLVCTNANSARHARAGAGSSGTHTGSDMLHCHSCCTLASHVTSGVMSKNTYCTVGRHRPTIYKTDVLPICWFGLMKLVRKHRRPWAACEDGTDLEITNWPLPIWITQGARILSNRKPPTAVDAAPNTPHVFCCVLCNSSLRICSRWVQLRLPPGDPPQTTVRMELELELRGGQGCQVVQSPSSAARVPVQVQITIDITHPTR